MNVALSISGITTGAPLGITVIVGGSINEALLLPTLKC